MGDVKQCRGRSNYFSPTFENWETDTSRARVTRPPNVIDPDHPSQSAFLHIRVYVRSTSFVLDLKQVQAARWYGVDSRGPFWWGIQTCRALTGITDKLWQQEAKVKKMVVIGCAVRSLKYLARVLSGGVISRMPEQRGVQCMHTVQCWCAPALMLFDQGPYDHDVSTHSLELGSPGTHFGVEPDLLPKCSIFYFVADLLPEFLR
jgi:hypothetical protein